MPAPVEEAARRVRSRRRAAGGSVSGANQLIATAAMLIAVAAIQIAGVAGRAVEPLGEERPDRDAEVERGRDEADGLAPPPLRGEVRRGGDAADEEDGLGRAEDEPHHDEEGDRSATRWPAAATTARTAPDDQHDPPPVLVRPAAGERAQEQRRDGERSDDEAHGQVVAAERALREPRASPAGTSRSRRRTRAPTRRCRRRPGS